MPNDTLFQPKSIGYYHDPYTTDLFKKPIVFDNDLILFSSSSEAFNRVSLERISVIGGRSSSGYAIPGKRFSDIITLTDTEKELFAHSLYHSTEKAAVFPLKNKILVIYNQLLRSNGLGIALIFDYSPKCLSFLLNNGALKSKSILISPSFSLLPEKESGANDFLSSFSRILANFNNSDTMSRFDPQCGIKEILNIINSASELIGCPLSVELEDIESKKLYLDRPTLMAFTLCMLSKARRLSKDRQATIKISAGKLFNISINYILYSCTNAEENIHEIDFCDKMAAEMGIPFDFGLDGDIYRASFIPYRADPSVLGFKAGIFINGMQITRLPW